MRAGALEATWWRRRALPKTEINREKVNVRFFRCKLPSCGMNFYRVLFENGNHSFSVISKRV